jgi:hypothetical protein
MKSHDLYMFLKNWIDRILNSEMNLGVNVIQSNQNAPRLKEKHIVIDFSYTRNSIGRAARTAPASAPNDADNLDELEEGTIYIVQDYLAIVELREENGTGDYLQYIIDSVERSAIQQYFYENKIAYMSNGDIQPVPRLDDNFWIKQTMVEIQLGITTQIKTTEDSWIDVVDYTGNIGGINI